MPKENIEISKIEDLDKLRTAPKLSKKQSELLFNEAKDIIGKADWITIGVMSPSLDRGISAVRKIEEEFQYTEMQCITIPSINGPIFLKANQRSGEIHARVEYGLGEGILISCHSEDSSLASRTIGPFPLDFFN